MVSYFGKYCCWSCKVEGRSICHWEWWKIRQKFPFELLPTPVNFSRAEDLSLDHAYVSGDTMVSAEFSNCVVASILAKRTNYLKKLFCWISLNSIITQFLWLEWWFWQNVLKQLETGFSLYGSGRGCFWDFVQISLSSWWLTLSSCVHYFPLQLDKLWGIILTPEQLMRSGRG
jgi:hypothetical protein